jgi:hypothetical protein
MMSNFGFAPGILDYWMLLSDWRNGSFAIMLALGVLLIGNAFATRNKILAAEGPRHVEGADPSDLSSWRPARSGRQRRPATTRRRQDRYRAVIMA